jgi:hypothetical protein
LIPLNPEVYAIPYVPFHANGAGCDMDRGGSAGDQHRRDDCLPARSASRILPVEILRFE